MEAILSTVLRNLYIILLFEHHFVEMKKKFYPDFPAVSQSYERHLLQFIVICELNFLTTF